MKSSKKKEEESSEQDLEVSDGSDLSDEHVPLRESDVAFVNQLTAEQLEFFTKRMNPKDFLTPLDLAPPEIREELDRKRERRRLRKEKVASLRAGKGRDGEESKGNREEEEEEHKQSQSSSGGESDGEEVEDKKEQPKAKGAKKSVDKIRAAPDYWDDEGKSANVLPIKRPDGTVKVQKLTREEVEERKSIQEKREAEIRQHAEEAAAEGKRKRRRKLEDVAPEHDEEKAVAIDQVDRVLHEDDEKTMRELLEYQEQLEAVPDKRADIESLCRDLLAQPEQYLKRNMQMLLRYCRDEDILIKQLAVLSLAAVFSDMIPSYRVREDDEEKTGSVVLTKEVRKLRKFERGMLKYYREFLGLMRDILSLRRPNPPSKQEEAAYESMTRARRFHVKTMAALSQMQVIAIRALSRVYLANPSFNYSDSLVEHFVAAANRTDVAGGALSVVAVTTIRDLFEKRAELEQILNCVTEIARVVKARRFKANPEILRCFLKLEISDAIADIDVRDEAVDKKRKHLTNKAKKARKLGKEVDRQVREAEAERRTVEVQRFQRRMAEAMFLTYFRVIKTSQNSPLLPAVLEGVARWCHLLNPDFMVEIVQALLKLLQNASLPLASAFHCAITAFQALRNSGDVFRIDLSDYYHFVYPRLIQLAFMTRGDTESGNLDDEEDPFAACVRCLQLMFYSKAYRILVRSAAFAKRLGTVSLHAPTNATIALLQLCRNILSTDSRLDQLIDPEDLGVQGTFSFDVNDPDNCNPFSTALFELMLLREHYHPHVALMAQQTLKNLPPAPHHPLDYLYSYDSNVQIFNPAVHEPGPNRFDKKLRKLAKYNEKKREMFQSSLLPEEPSVPNEYFEECKAKGQEWIDSVRKRRK